MSLENNGHVNPNFSDDIEKCEIDKPPDDYQNGIRNRNFENFPDEKREENGMKNKNFEESESFSIEKTSNVDSEKELVKSWDKIKNRNVFILGLVFMFIFAGVLTNAATTETILRSFKERTGKSSSGFLSMGIAYLTTGLTEKVANLISLFPVTRNSMKTFVANCLCGEK